MTFYDLKNLLPQSVQRTGAARQVEAFNIIEQARKIIHGRMGKHVSSQTNPAYIKDKILAIQCDSSLVMQELKYHEQDIIFLLNKMARKNVVSRIKYFS